MVNKPPPDKSLPGKQPSVEPSLIGTAIKRSAEHARGANETNSADLKADEALEEAKLQTQKDRLKKDHERDERFRDAANVALISAFWIIVAGIVVMGAAWFYHLIAPEKWLWLTAAQLGKLQNLLTGGVVTSVLVKYFESKL